MLGQVFGKLRVLASAPKTDKNLKWECVCTCGNITVVRASNLRTGKTVSCGCAQTAAVTKHGGKGTRLYTTWSNMRRRCYDPKAKDYANYGGRGISYPKEWNDFGAFQQWALSTGYTDLLTIDREDVNADYSVNNCRWVDWNVQASNQRKELNTSSTYLGVTQRSPSKWEANVKRIGLNYYVGVYPTELQAAQARDAYITSMGWPHKLNF